MEKSIVQITKVDKTQHASTFKEGEFYWRITVVDGKTGRTASLLENSGENWAQGWKIGDEIEAVWERKDYVSKKTGENVEAWTLKNPNAAPKKPWVQRGGSGGGMTPLQHATLVSATLLAPHLVGKKIDTKLVHELAQKILKEMTDLTPAEAAPAAPAPVAAPVAPVKAAPVAEVKNTAPVVTDEEFVEDEDKPF